ncbi:probable methyltransferase TARBP1 isoform X2 [Hypomesus transpacificus]|uniref:probable methyltransferase TARBP1 isoform X2 n=1 Tax=Hypomesus transpacificus TaxID=137520 RepID=UPI001F081880|nr:probable methyltransferase TARBP1 isoform X2 [Hypomesus transpacificus]
MSAILIEAVLSCSPNHEALFNALCWPSDAWPEKERIEALAAFIDGIDKQSDTSTGGKISRRQDVLVRVESIIWKQCMPLLYKISSECKVCNGEQDSRSKEMTSAVCRLLSICIALCDSGVTAQLTRSVLPTLRQSNGDTDDESNGDERLHIDLAIEVLSVLLPALSADEQLSTTTLTCALSCIRVASDALVSKITVRILFTLLTCYSEEKLAKTLQFVLDDLCRWHAGDSSPVATERALLCLTALSDYLLAPVKPTNTPQSPASARPDPRLSLQFWRILQDGLTHRDTVSRKRALYLLKRCVALSEEEGQECPRGPASGEGEEVVFRWVPGSSKLLRAFWEDYALVMETVEENQIHVVRPVLSRVDSLIQTTARESQACLLPVLHPSWLLCVYQRMFHSENKAVMREGVSHLLGLQTSTLPAFSQTFSQFIVGPFMDVLSESSLFHRSQDQCVGECPELGLKLQSFLVSFFRSLPMENRGSVLQQLVQRLASQHWCSVPVLFVSQALSLLPPGPLLGPQTLQALREVLRCTMVTHQVLLRGAAQCFLLSSALCLTDVSSVTLDDVFSLLVHFPANESLCRGTGLWNQVCVWLVDSEGSFRACGSSSRVEAGEGAGPAAPERDSVLGYVQRQMEAYLRVPASTDQTDCLPDPGEANMLATAILLWADMEDRREGGRTGERLPALLLPLVATLGRLSTNVYLPLRKTDKSLQLLLRLLQLRHAPCRPATEERQADHVAVAMDALLAGVVESIQEFILRRLSGELQELCDMQRAELYLVLLRELLLASTLSSLASACLPRLASACLPSLLCPASHIPTVASQVTKAVAMASLAMLCDLANQDVINSQSETVSVLLSLKGFFHPPASPSSPSVPLGLFNQTLLKPPAAGSSARSPGPGVSLQDWGRMAARFTRDQWVCLGFLRRAGPPLAPPGAPGALQAAVEALALLPSHLVLPVLAFMEAELPQVALCGEEVCAEAVRRSWALVQALSSNPQDFWPTLRAFTRMAYSPPLLGLSHTQAPLLTHTLREISAELIELSQIKTGVFNVLIQHCCDTWTTSDTGSTSQPSPDTGSSLLQLDILTEACVYGPVFRRDQRLIQEVQSYVEKLGEQCSANTVVPSDDRDEQAPRVFVLGFLSGLEPSSQQHQTLMEELVLRLLRKDEEISKSKTRYYSNSLQHRVKNRVWQTLLLLLPKLREEFVNTIARRIFEAGFCSNQASVKYLMEWMMVLLLVRFPAHIDKLWSCFTLDQEKTKTSICTYLSVLVHLNIIMPTLPDKSVQWRRALDVILQWCFSHNFSVRLYALLALKRVWGLEGARGEAEAGAGGMDGLGGLATLVQSCLNQAEAMQSTGNANKNWSRIQEHFFFGAFHPIRDHSVESIFYLFPRLSELADDEWLPVWKFEKLVAFSRGPYTLPLRNPSPELGLVPPGDWVQQDKGEQEREECWTEVQKKMTPWRLGMVEQGPELQLAPQQRAARLGKLHSALLVVASLIDKPTNLGGLCRTCEIFGASGLVLDSLRHVSDKQFLSLSVSAELWLPLLEVKPAELSRFLLQQKERGYCIVGVEQTANSHSLQDYRFPERTLLLLGNEREGIPAPLLQLLDVCVEIPQQGVVRSLNVHVSAALLVWEYTRQHRAPPPGAPPPGAGPGGCHPSKAL